MGCRCGGAEVVRATGWLPVIGTEAGGTEAAAPAELGAASGASIGMGAGGAAAAACSAAGGAASASADWWYFSRMGHHEGSTDSRFCLYCSYISSTSHSLAPNSPAAPPSAACEAALARLKTEWAPQCACTLCTSVLEFLADDEVHAVYRLWRVPTKGERSSRHLGVYLKLFVTADVATWTVTQTPDSVDDLKDICVSAAPFFNLAAC